MELRKPSKTELWVRCAQNAEMVAGQLQHPTMQILRSVLEMMGRASRDSAWLGDSSKREKLNRAMELIVEITSVPPPGSSSKTLR